MGSTNRQADAQLVTALKQRLLARAAPRLAHDLNNDLTIISGQAELAQRRGDLRTHERMEQIKLAAGNARQRNELVQQLARDDAGTAAESSKAVIPGDLVAEEVQRLAALLSHRDLAFEAAASGLLPAVDRTRLRWLAGAVLLAALPPEGVRGSINVELSQGGGGLRLECHAEGVELADWLPPTLACCATTADATPNGDGWQALIILAEAL